MRVRLGNEAGPDRLVVVLPVPSLAVLRRWSWGCACGWTTRRAPTSWWWCSRCQVWHVCAGGAGGARAAGQRGGAGPAGGGAPGAKFGMSAQVELGVRVRLDNEAGPDQLVVVLLVAGANPLQVTRQVTLYRETALTLNKVLHHPDCGHC